MPIPMRYHVSPLCGGWQVRCGNDTFSSRFVALGSAIGAAQEAGELHWQMSGLATCVDIEDEDGTIVEEMSFGVQADE
jgi:hypothetical protein